MSDCKGNKGIEVVEIKDKDIKYTMDSISCKHITLEQRTNLYDYIIKLEQQNSNWIETDTRNHARIHNLKCYIKKINKLVDMEYINILLNELVEPLKRFGIFNESHGVAENSLREIFEKAVLYTEGEIE